MERYYAEQTVVVGIVRVVDRVERKVVTTRATFPAADREAQRRNKKIQETP